MTPTAESMTIFVGGPFKGNLDPVSGEYDPAARQALEALLEEVEGLGCSVLSAHRCEDWGRVPVTAEECTERDLRWMRECDGFLATLGPPMSFGTHVELGWASALGKPTVVMLDPDTRYAALATGLSAISQVRYVVGRLSDAPARAHALQSLLGAIGATPERGSRPRNR